MKLALALLVLVMNTAIANAGDVYCGANSESKKGSRQYDKLIFWEKADTSKSLAIIYKQDGTSVKVDGSTPDVMKQINDGDIAIFVSFSEGKANIGTAKVKRDAVKVIDYQDLAVAVPGSGKSVTLLSNGLAVMCIEQ